MGHLGILKVYHSPNLGGAEALVQRSLSEKPLGLFRICHLDTYGRQNSGPKDVYILIWNL